VETKEYIQQGSNVFVKTYAQFPLVIKRGEGRYLYDIEEKRYLDLVGGIATNLLGYNNQLFISHLKETLSHGVTHISNLYWNTYAIEAATLLASLSGLKRVFFTNSGTEANEAAIKLARKWGKQRGRSTIISMVDSFHGRTLGALSATGQSKYQSSFSPMVEDFTFATFGDIDSLKEMIDDSTSAIMVEIIQGEGGIHTADQDYWDQLSLLCEEHDLLLIIDEVQTGMGRTGEVFAYQHFNLKPDIITLAKGLGGGIPVGAMVCSKRVEDVFVPGDHGATFGGNLFSSSAAQYLLTLLEEGSLLRHVQQVSTYLRSQLENRYPQVIEIRGMGLMVGLEFDQAVRPIIDEAMNKGLLLVNAGEKVLRMVPPLTITEDEIDEALQILDEILLS